MNILPYASKHAKYSRQTSSVQSTDIRTYLDPNIYSLAIMLDEIVNLT